MITFAHLNLCLGVGDTSEFYHIQFDEFAINVHVVIYYFS